MTTTENNVAAQAGDEPMRAAFEALAVPDGLNVERGFKNGYRDADTRAAYRGFKLAQGSPRATADVERDAEIAKVVWQLISDGVLDHVLTGSDESGHEESFGSDTEEMAYLIASIKSARTRIATTKPGA